MPRYTSALAAVALAAGTLGLSAPANAQEKILGEIFPVAFNFCPRGSAAADGQILPINQNQALFSLFGTLYGGDGRTTFALPDLRSRSPMHAGRGPALTQRSEGQRFGSETNTLAVANMPAHSHSPQMRVSRVNATRRNPIDSYFARSLTDMHDQTTVPDNFMAADAIESNVVGGGQPMNNMMPTLVINYCVVMQGLFPSRS